MTHRTITASLALVVALATATVACSSSGDDAADTSAPATSAPVETTDEATTTDPTTTVDEGTTTTGPGDETEGETATTATSGGLPSCQDLLVEYAEVFTPDDLQPVIDRFRAWAPDMPAEVGAAVERLADAYEEADAVLGNLDFADVDLTADAQTFSDWTNEGCPPG